MNNEEFKTREQLYQRLLPALRVKKKEMHHMKMYSITEIDIWNYFCLNVWNRKSALTLGEMVNDILNTDNYVILSSRRSN